MIRVELLKDKGIVIVTPEGKLEASDFDRTNYENQQYALAAK